MQTDGHDEANSRFSQFCERAWKTTVENAERLFKDPVGYISFKCHARELSCLSLGNFHGHILILLMASD